MPRWLLTVLALLLTTATGRPEMTTQAVEYRHADKVLEGCLVGDTRFLAEVVPLELPAIEPASPPVGRTGAVERTGATDPPPPKGVPEKALKVLKYVDKEGSAPPGYEGGRTFLNVEKLLPQTDAQGRRIKYREWDVNPLKPGVNRGPERLVTGSDGSAYYTGDHYKTFKKIR